MGLFDQLFGTQQPQAPATPMALPNGGLQGAALQAAIQANPGPQAMVGFNPNNPSQLQLGAAGKLSSNPEDEDDNQDDSPAAPANPTKALLNKYKTLLNPPKKEEAAPESKQSTKDILASLLGQNSDDLKAAQAQRDHNQLIARLGEAASGLTSGLLPMNRTGADPAFYNKLLDDASKPVTDLQTKQAMAKSSVQNQIDQTKAATDLDKTDPNSAISVAARQLYNKTTGKTPDPAMTASDVEGLQKQSDTVFNAEQNRLMRQALAGQQAGLKSNGKQDMALNQATQQLESARGNPEVQQALKDRYAASKVSELTSTFPDPNNLSPQQVHLLIDEVSKIATGGVPAEGQVAAMMPDTMRMKMAKLWSNLQNSPQPAQAGEFIKQYQDYVKQLNDGANKVINDKYGRVIESRKKQLGDDNYNTLKSQYLGDAEAPKAKAAAPAASAHPQDAEAIAWARANPGDQANAILKANGINN